MLADGNYSFDGGESLQINGTTRIIGNPASRPTIRNLNSDESAVLSAGSGADLVIENVIFADAASTLSPIRGAGFACIAGVARVRFHRVRFENNRGPGLRANNCVVQLFDSESIGNRDGANITGSVATIERSVFVSNSVGARLVTGGHTIRNSIFARSTFDGVLMPVEVGATFEFNTVVDNGVGVTCEQDGSTTLALDNSIFARNGTSVGGTGCTTTTSLVAPNVAGLDFVRPDISPFDYHIGPGSSAIDQATGGDMVVVDIDGEPRPAGAARDLGADELQ